MMVPAGLILIAILPRNRVFSTACRIGKTLGFFFVKNGFLGSRRISLNKPIDAHPVRKSVKYSGSGVDFSNHWISS